MTTTEENNKLIAEFVKYNDVDCFDCKYTRDCNWLQCNLTPQEKIEQLKYHSSWDWLMLVIKECSNIADTFEFDTPEYKECENIFYTDAIVGEFLHNDIDSVYSRVVDFIKWYSTWKQKTVSEPLFVNANAICFVCGTVKENPIDGYCINGHDDWVEKEDDFARLMQTAMRFNTSVENIVHAIKNNICLTNNEV